MTRSVNLQDARWRADDLGAPLPDSPHAVSVCLPTWADNVGYEEADPNVTTRLRAGYPRFFLHPTVRRYFEATLAAFGSDLETVCYVFPSAATAARCQNYVRLRCDQPLRSQQVGDHLFAVFGRETTAAACKEFWQHSGEIIPSRVAEAALKNVSAPISATDAKRTIREHFANIAQCNADDVYLFSSGMAAIYLAWRVICRLRPEGRTVQFGFPYVDTLKIQERFISDGVRFFPTGDQTELTGLKDFAIQNSVRGLFCETPANPLLVTPDLNALRDIAGAHDFPLIVDDTLGALINLDVREHADLTVTSLTKFFSGGGDVLAGALVVNPDRPLGAALKPLIEQEFEDLLYDQEAACLEANSRDAVSRVTRINSTAEQLCDFLINQTVVESVYYPKYSTPAHYSALKRESGGYGGLFSIVLRDRSAATRVFDALQISKGPNLGTNFSLACPFTILAHYNELDFAEECGVSRYLIRVSVGLEEFEELKHAFETALEAV